MLTANRFHENIASVIAAAFYEEDPDKRDYYKLSTLSETKKCVLADLLADNIEDLFNEMKYYLYDFREDMAAEFPKSFSAMTIMAYLSDNEDLKEEWAAIVNVASNPGLFHSLAESYEEYYDMADPDPSEAKEEIIHSIFAEDYDLLLLEWKENIEWRELDKSQYPKTFHAVEVLENVIAHNTVM